MSLAEFEQVHVRYDGNSYDFNRDNLPIGEHITEESIFEAVASRLNVPVKNLMHYRLDYNKETKVAVIRPEAVFG